MESNIDESEGHTSLSDDMMEAGFKSNVVEKVKEEDAVHADEDVSCPHVF